MGDILEGTRSMSWRDRESKGSSFTFPITVITGISQQFYSVNRLIDRGMVFTINNNKNNIYFSPPFEEP